MGIFYFSKIDLASGRLYWKDNGVYKQALEVQFDLAELDTINQIIETIKSIARFFRMFLNQNSCGMIALQLIIAQN